MALLLFFIILFHFRQGVPAPRFIAKLLFCQKSRLPLNSVTESLEIGTIASPPRASQPRVKVVSHAI